MNTEEDKGACFEDDFCNLSPINSTDTDMKLKESMRCEISNDVEEFIRNGGKIEVVPEGKTTGKFDEEFYI